MKRIRLWSALCGLLFLSLNANLLALPSNLVPSVKIAGEWLDYTDCQSQLEELSCGNQTGKITLSWSEIDSSYWQLEMSYIAEDAVLVEGLRLQGGLSGAQSRFLSNGFQSWSNSGWVNTSTQLSDAELKSALEDDDENRDGLGLSWDYTYIVTDQQSVFLGSLGAARLKPWIEVYKESDKTIFNITAGGAGETIALQAGEVLQADSWILAENPEPKAVLKGYASLLKSYPEQGPVKTGWNSWYYYWAAVDEQDIREHVETVPPFISEQFNSAGRDVPPMTLVVDDGWESMWGDWVANDKFASIETLATDIKNAGLEAGIWIAPFLASDQSEVYANHPEWFVADKTYSHPTGTYYILDTSHPEAQEHLFNTVKSLVDAGYKKLKVDFLMVGTVEGQRYKAITGMEAFHLGMDIIRRAAGSETYILACGSPGLAVFSYVNAWRLGADIAFEYPTRWLGPTWTDVVDQARNLSARWFLCDLIHCDTDPALLREPHSPTSAITASWLPGLAGGGLYFSDRISQLEPDQADVRLPALLLDNALSGRAGHPDPIIPVLAPDELYSPSLWDRIVNGNNVQAPVSWKTPQGESLFLNWYDETMVVEEGAVPAKDSLLLSN